ncbi:MAG: dual specificity protein phosphatase, partial [Ktedonobacterales bacterium]
DEPYTELNDLPAHHDARRIFNFQHVAAPSWGEIYVLGTACTEGGLMVWRGHDYQLEPRDEEPQTVEYLRRWAITPASPVAPNSHRPVAHRRFGGDPVPIRLGRRVYRQRLFLGGVGLQGEQRPDVDAVLNLCEEPNPWSLGESILLADRVARKGELGQGMRADDLRAEAEWVAERLRDGQRVLVHCVAGINRSSSVACATLMLLEGMTPEQALACVRSVRPQAWPDPYHWFALARLAEELGIAKEPQSPDRSNDDDGLIPFTAPLCQEAAFSAAFA